MSFVDGFFGENEFSPKPRKRNGNGNGNGKRRGFGNGRRSAKEAAEGFEAPDVFSGLRGNGDISKVGGGGIPKVDSDVGVAVPELGGGFNSRIGNIGQGFVESVNPFKIGFTDILTGNGRTGEIIGAGADLRSTGLKRGRGRPKGTTKQVLKARKKAKKKGFDIDTTKEVRELRKAGKTDQIESKTVGGLLKESIRGGVPSGASERPRPIATREIIQRGEVEFETLGTDPSELEIEKEVDRENVEGIREKLSEIQEGAEEEAVAEETLKDLDLEEEVVAEDEVPEEENGLDEDMENVNEDDFSFEVEGGEIRRKDDE